jgi:hypothetical protein
MIANSSELPEAEETAKKPEPLPWGQNLLGITYISEDFYEDIPLEFFLAMMNPTNSFFPMRIPTNRAGRPTV